MRVQFNLKDITTLAGFLMQKLGRMPVQGDKVIECGFVFVVTQVLGPKVKKVNIQPTEMAVQATVSTRVAETA